MTTICLHAVIADCAGDQGAYNSGKRGKLREFFNSAKLWENSANFKFTQGIFVSEIVRIEFCA